MSSDNKQANKQADGISKIYLVSLCCNFISTTGRFSFPQQWCKSGAEPCLSCDGYQAQIKLFRSFLCGLEMSGQAQIWIQVNGLSVKTLESPKGICITLPRWDSGGFEKELCCLNRSCCPFSGDSCCFQPGKISSKHSKKLSHGEVDVQLPDFSS